MDPSSRQSPPAEPRLPRALERARLLAVVLLLGGVANLGAAWAEGSGRSLLQPLPWPAVESFDPQVRDILEQQRNRLEALAEAPDTPADQLGRAFAEVGQLYLYYGLQEPAGAALGNAHVLLPEDLRWPYLLGTMAQDRGRLEEAREWLERALERRPNDLPSLLRLSTVELGLGYHESAAERARKALALGEPAAAHQALGRALLARGENTAALEHLLRALDLQPEATSLHQQIGLAHRRLRDEERAREHLLQAGPAPVRFGDPLIDSLERFAAGVHAHLTRGNQAFRAGRYREAAEAFRRAVAAAPDNASARLNLGAALSRMGELPAAVEEYRRAAEIDPRLPMVHYNLGTLYGQLGDHVNAAQSFGRALELDPRFRPGLFNLATALGHLGRFEEAAEVYGRLIDLDPQSTVAWISRATALALAGREAAAREVLEDAIEAHPHNLELAQALARLLSAATDVAVRDAPRALRLALAAFLGAQTVERAETVAMALAEAGSFEHAVAWQTASLETMDGEDHAPLLEEGRRRLESYQQGRPVRAPWRESGLLIPPPSGLRIPDPDPLPLPPLGDGGQ
jgi:tetratricopeptide (TPR) repeat protein